MVLGIPDDFHPFAMFPPPFETHAFKAAFGEVSLDDGVYLEFQFADILGVPDIRKFFLDIIAQLKFAANRMITATKVNLKICFNVVFIRYFILGLYLFLSCGKFIVIFNII